MPYSVLHIGYDGACMLWCSVQEKAILRGAESEMYDFKELLERGEQVESNKQHFIELKEKYIGMLIAGGHSKTQANAFLKLQMPFLYDNN